MGWFRCLVPAPERLEIGRNESGKGVLSKGERDGGETS